jgi:hypothetical protein
MHDDMNEIYDKEIILLDSDNAVFKDSTKMDIYVDILEPIKNVAYIKIIQSCISLNPKFNFQGNIVEDNDPIYISVNDYYRVKSVINVNGEGSLLKCFDMINIDLTGTYNLTNNFNIQQPTQESSSQLYMINLTYKNDYRTLAFDVNDHSVYKLRPMEANLKRFNIELRDKNNKIIERNNIGSFKMIICVYSLRKNM